MSLSTAQDLLATFIFNLLSSSNLMVSRGFGVFVFLGFWG